MSIYPAQAVSSDKIKLRWREPYVSEAINKKFLGIPNGVYRGFTPTVVGDIIRLIPDTDSGDSVLNVESSGTDVAHTTIYETSNVDLDFAGHTVWPVFIVAESDYTIGSTTTAEFKTIDAQEIVHTVGGSPVTVDLSTVTAPVNLPVRAGSFNLAVTLNGGAPGVITDDGAGTISGTGMTGTGTISYTTGALTGTTLTLQASSTIILTYEWPAVGLTLVKVCKVDKPAAVLTVDTSVPSNRHEPVAYAGVTVGYMPGGSIEDLQAAVVTTAEVEQARIGFTSTYGSLDDRLDAELAGGAPDGMATRLALRGKMIETKVWDSGLLPDERYWSSSTDPGWAGTGTSANVSDDFKDKTRSTGPTVKGVVVDDAEHDHVRLMDRNFRQFVDETGLPVYGRLSYDEITIPDGGAPGLTFTNGGKAVVGTGTSFQAAGPGDPPTVAAGDIIQGPDGNFYTVDTVSSNLNLDLLENYALAPAPTTAVDRIRRRYTLSFHKFDAAEQAHDFTASTEFRYWWQELFDAEDQTVFADAVDIRQKGYAGSVPDATETDKGIVQLAPDLDPSSSLAVQGSDSRLGAVKGRANAGLVSGLEGVVRLIAGAGMSVALVESSGELQFTITATGGSWPGPSLSTPLADTPGGAVGAEGLTADGLHRHPLSPSYAIQTNGVPFTALAGNIVIPTGFTPRLAIFVGDDASNQNLTVGIAINSGSANQGCVDIIYSAGSVFSQNLARIAVGSVTTWNIQSGGWTTTNVTATRTGTGSIDGFGIVIGDNLP